MARIRFNSDQVFESEGLGKGPRFAKDSVLDESGVAEALGKTNVTPEYAQSFLNRWVQRGVAEYVDEKGGKLRKSSGDPLPPPAPQAPQAEIPADWETYNAEDTKALAVELGANDEQARTKADAVEFIQAEVNRRSAT